MAGISVLGSLRSSAFYVLAETRRHRRAFCIGTFTVFIVVFFVALLQTAVQSSPVIFFKLAEETAGANDLVLTPLLPVSTSPSIPIINHTLVNVSESSVPLVAGTAPRWALLVQALSPVSGPTQASTTSIALVADDRQERFLQIGRALIPSLPPLARNQTYVSRTVCRQLNYDVSTAVGKTIIVQLDFVSLLQTLNVLSARPTPSQIEQLLIAAGITTASNSSVPVVIDIQSTLFLLNAFAKSFNVNASDIVLPASVYTLTLSAGQSFPLIINRPSLSPMILNLTLPLDTQLANGVITSTTPSLIVMFLPVFSTILVQQLPLGIAAVIDDPLGKWPQTLGNVLVLDSGQISDLINTFAPTLATALSTYSLIYNQPQLQPFIAALTALSQRLQFSDYAFLSIIQYAKRETAYMSDSATLAQDMVTFSNKASEALGTDAFPASFSLPIVDALQVTVFIRMFLDNIFGAILFLLVLLSALLVYSLLLGDVESKTYEYGMLRALGMRHSSLMQILLIKSSAFSLLGISIGLFIAWVANIPVAILVADYASIAPHLGLTGGAVLTAVLLGWLMPGVANIVPIQRALSSTLRDALDIYHHTASEISVSIQRLADKGLDLWQTVLSVFMIVVGFVVFYLIPYAFTFRNFSVFLGLLNAILMGMLFGLAILASLVQPYLEKMWTFIMVRWSHSKLRPLVLKNLSAHRDRNSKTAHMFVICLAFVVFAGVMFSLQTKSIADNVRVLFGADLFILAPTLSDALRETEMSQHLDSLISKGGCVLDYTFVTFDLSKTAAIQSAQFANLPTFPSFSQPIYGVQSNYLNVAFNQFAVTVSPASLDTKTASGKPDPVASLWHPVESPFAFSSSLQSLVVGRMDPGYGDQSSYRNAFMQQMSSLYNSTIPLVVSAALSDFASVSANTALQVTITAKVPPQGIPDEIKETIVYLCRANAMVSKMPSFYYSSYSQTVRASPVLMRMSDFDTILQQAYRATGNAALAPARSPKSKLLVKLKPNTPREQREDVLNGLRNFFTSNKIVSQDTQTVLDSTQSAADLLNLFFNVVGLIAMSLCFFILLLSFTANVNENAWEFGVLRAIGLSDVQVCAVYVYEALALALSCIMSGTLVGILIAISLTLQFNLFTEMPFEFAFPYALFFSMVLLSLICAVWGSYQPAQKLLRKSISNTIRGL